MKRATPEEMVMITGMGKRMFKELKSLDPNMAGAVITYLIATFCMNTGCDVEMFNDLAQELIDADTIQ